MQKVEWIYNESLELVGYGVKKKGDKFEISNELAEQLIYQKVVKDVYVEKKKKIEKDVK